MSLPAIPYNFYAQTGNGQNYLSWDKVGSATSYVVQRSLDNITFTTVATPSIPEYLDATVSVGTEYWYQVASSNASGTSGYTSATSVVPTEAGEMSLGQLRLLSKQRADRENSEFVTMPEWNSYINQSLTELYDLLVTIYEDYHIAEPIYFNTGNNVQNYPLPDGTLQFNNAQGTAFIARPFYKLIGVDLGLNTASNAFVTVPKFSFINRNRFVYPNTASTIYGVFNLQYRVMGKVLQFVPIPTSGQPMRVWYIPRMAQLLKDTDMTDTGVNGWLEYVIVDAAIKALQKEESDVSVLMAQKAALKERIESTAQNRDAGQPDKITDVTQGNPYGYNGPFNGFGGGW